MAVSYAMRRSITELIIGKARNINLNCVRRKTMATSVPTLSNQSTTNELFHKAKWMVKYGLPWMQQYGQVTNENIAKFLDSDVEVVYKINVAMRGKR